MWPHHRYIYVRANHGPRAQGVGETSRGSGPFWAFWVGVRAFWAFWVGVKIYIAIP